MRSNAFTATMEKYIFGEGSCAFLGGSDLWPLLLFPVDPGSPLNPGTPRIYKRGRSAQRFQTPLWIYVNIPCEPIGSIPKMPCCFSIEALMVRSWFWIHLNGFLINPAFQWFWLVCEVGEGGPLFQHVWFLVQNRLNWMMVFSLELMLG